MCDACQEERQFVKLVISDCTYGARLWVEFFPYVQGQRGQLAARCAMLVEKTRRRFVGGIKQIIGVTHFVSKNLTHHEDHLQAGYAYLLENALASVPGIAVIETEEAQAIGRELRLAGDELGQGLVPLLITGEFETSRARAGDELTVHLVVEVSDGAHALWKFDRKGLTFAKATDLLAGEIPSLVVRLAKNQATVGISREQQQKLLEARAAMFSSLGAWEHSTGLREAALLLDPNHVEVRLSVIADYVRRQIFHKREQLPVVPGKYVEGKPELNPEEWNVWDKIRDERVAL